MTSKNLKNISAVIAILIVGVSLPLALKLLSQPATYKVPALEPTVNLSILPATKNLPPDSVFRIMLDAGTNKLSFARVSITFDKDKSKINLKTGSDITTTPLMSRIIKKSTITEANTAGGLVIALAVPPGVAAPTGLIEMASFTVTAVSVVADDTAGINFVVSDTQVVDDNAVSLNKTVSSATLLLNPTVSTPTASPSATLTPTQTATPTPSILPTSTPTPASGTLTLSVNSGGDDVNEDGSTLSLSDSTVWIGTGASTTLSYTGLRFTGVNLPKGAKISSAILKLYSTQSQWMSISLSMAGDLTGNSSVFSSSSKPSGRTLTAAKVTHSSNVSWSANAWYTLNEDLSAVVQEIVNQSSWTSGNSLSIILKGTGGSYARKYIKSYEGGGTYSPQLIITYAQ